MPKKKDKKSGPSGRNYGLPYACCVCSGGAGAGSGSGSGNPNGGLLIMDRVIHPGAPHGAAKKGRVYCRTHAHRA
jgi:hypothetical protein